MSNPDLNVSKRDNLLLVLLALIAGVAFDYLFYAKTPGISYLIFVLLVLGIFWWSVRDKITPDKSFGWLVLIPILLLINDGPLLQSGIVRHLRIFVHYFMALLLVLFFAGIG